MRTAVRRALHLCAQDSASRVVCSETIRIHSILLKSAQTHGSLKGSCVTKGKGKHTNTHRHTNIHTHTHTQTLTWSQSIPVASKLLTAWMAASTRSTLLSIRNAHSSPCPAKYGRKRGTRVCSGQVERRPSRGLRVHRQKDRVENRLAWRIENQRKRSGTWSG